MKRTRVFLSVALAALGAAGAVPVFYDDFDSLYVEGQDFTSATNGWQSSGPSAVVTTTGAYSNLSVALSGAVVLTNVVAADAGLRIWTDLRVRPLKGELPDSAPTNTASFMCYFDGNGILTVATNSGWLSCSNDVWGQPAPVATNDAEYVRLSFFQDYASSNQAVFLNGQLLAQDLPFTSTGGRYDRLGVENGQNESWIDNVWVQTNYDAFTLTNDFNSDGLADAGEIQLYGYAQRTLYVCATETNLVPVFSNITSAVAVWRPRDIVYVIGSDYAADSVTLPIGATAVAFEGDAFTVGFLAVPAGAAAAFAQSVGCGMLALTGQVTLATGASLTATTARVAGTLAVPSPGVFAVTNLVAGPSATINADTVAQTADLVGDAAFGGTLSVAAGMAVYAGAAATFAQSVTCGALALTGQVTLASGASLTAGPAYVAGTLTVPSPALFVASDLVVGPAAVLHADTLAQSATILGNATFDGTLSVAGSMTVYAGAAVAFSRSVDCDSLAVTGQVAMAEGASLTCSAARVDGTLSFSTNGMFTVGQLDIYGAGHFTFTSNSALQATGAGVNMDGPLELTSTWSDPGLVSMPLPFVDTFDAYGLNTLLSGLKFRGWYASDAGPRVQADVAYSGKAVELPEGSVASNSIATAETKIWTDFRIQPLLGPPPDEVPTNRAAFVAYANEQGYLVVAVPGGWRVCSNKLDAARSPVAPLAYDAFARISIFHDLTAHTFAVFVNDELVAEGLPAPNNTATYTSLGVDNRSGWTPPAYMDEVAITATWPGDLTGDLDDDGIPDASEIQRFGVLSAYPRGTDFRFR